MKIGKPVVAPDLRRGGARWNGIIPALATIKDGQALPVECDSRKDAQALQYYLFGYSHKLTNGRRLQVQRRDMTVYISWANAK